MSESQPLSVFVRLMQGALKAIQEAKTLEERKAAEDNMALLIRTQNRREP